LPIGSEATSTRAVIIYGVSVEAPWDYSRFTVELAEYNIEKQDISGNCLRFNRTEANISALPGEIKYFAFDAPAGYYVYSPFNGAGLLGNFYAFEAPAGKNVYVGDFILKKDRLVTLNRDFDKVKSQMAAALPALSKEIALSKVTVVRAPHPFLCAP
ncbi:MAG: hypothetical protein JO002_11190, partial [Burkholderiaceae bacterium]|nr:hypothetical protein [Burkholderiaceae bacterium]